VREQTVDVLVAGYPGLAPARAAFAALCCQVRDGWVTTEYGVILVAKDLTGTVTLAGAGDHAGREGLRQLKDSLAEVTGGPTPLRALLPTPGRGPRAARAHAVGQPVAE
jgi:hypothetical protein